MVEIIGQQTKFIMVKETENNDGGKTQVPIFYNEYNFTLTDTQNLDQATKFDDLETAQQVASLQNQMAVIFKKRFKYVVVQEDINRKLVE